jgi:hypothetical protein
MLASDAGFAATKEEQFAYLQWLIDRNMNAKLIDKIYMSGNLPTSIEEYIQRIEHLDGLWRMKVDIAGCETDSLPHEGLIANHPECKT